MQLLCMYYMYDGNNTHQTTRKQGCLCLMHLSSTGRGITGSCERTSMQRPDISDGMFPQICLDLFHIFFWGGKMPIQNVCESEAFKKNGGRLDKHFFYHIQSRQMTFFFSHSQLSELVSVQGRLAVWEATLGMCRRGIPCQPHFGVVFWMKLLLKPARVVVKESLKRCFFARLLMRKRCPVLIKTAAIAAFTLQQPQFTGSQ